MSVIMLGIGDYGATNKSGHKVKTMALGSCVGVVFLDPGARAVGMAHVALPDSSIDPRKKAEKPGYFADTAVPALLEAMRGAGARGELRSMYVKLVGGANVLGSNISFDIGRRNVLALKKILWQYKTGPVAEDVEGNFSRTVSVDVDTGVIEISCPGKGVWTL